MKLDLKNKNALVCGSTKGIGKATAIAMAKEGVNVTLIARNESKLKQVVRQLSNDEQQHGYIVADFQNPEDLNQKVKAYLGEHNAFHILVNNTGGPKGGPVYEADIAEFEAAFSQHLKCNHVLAQALVPEMKKIGYGRIINVISTSVKQPIDGLGVSNTTRGAVASWSKTLANELGQFNITVNNVLPGATSTERLAEIINSEAEKRSETVEEFSEFMKRGIPLGRFANPREVANAIVFLASEAASYINGVNLPVDGGSTKSL